MRKLVLPFLILTSISLTGKSISEIDDHQRISDQADSIHVDLSEFQVTAFRVPGQLKSLAGAVSVIPNEKIEISDFNISSVLNSVPGIAVQEGTFGTMKLTLRGIGSRYPYGTKKIKLFFGDIPMYSMEGETTYDDINPEYLDHIEVLRGPASSIHGSSLGGTIILYPVKPDYQKEGIQLISSAGSFGLFKTSISYSRGSPKNNTLLSLSGIESEGYRQNNEYSRYSFFINQNNFFGKNFSGNLILSGSTIRSQIPSSVDSLTYSNNPKSAAATWLKTKGYDHPNRIFGGYNLTGRLRNNWNISSSVFASLRESEENRPFNFLNESSLTYGGRILAQHSVPLRKMILHFAAGSNLYLERLKNSISENIRGLGEKGSLQQKGLETLYQADLFTQMEASFSNIKITAGINFNRSGFHFTDLFSSDTLNQTGAYNFDLILAPRVSFSWNPAEFINIYTSVNKGFSIPSLIETLSPLGLINRDIKPEKALSIESGFRLNLFQRATFFDLAVYWMPVSDLIIPKRVAEDVYVGMNAGSSYHRGIEIALQQRIIDSYNSTSGRGIALLANLSYSLNKYTFENFIENDVDFSGKKLPGMPDQIFSGNLEIKTPFGLYGNAEINTSGKIPLNDLNSSFSKAWQVINIKAGYIFTIKKLQIDPSLSIKNLTDEKYASMLVVNAPGSVSMPPRYYYPALPRWFTCTVRISI